MSPAPSGRRLLKDHQVDRPGVQGGRPPQRTGTNSRTLDRTDPGLPRTRSRTAVPHGATLTLPTTSRRLPGGHTRVATPVPVPNTAVKHPGPMVVLPARE